MRALVGTVVLAVLAGIALVWMLGSVLVAPAPRDVGPPPPGAEAAAIPSASGTLAAWVQPADSARGVVVLMHGVRADRRSQVERMRLFHEAGYAVVAFDFQAHGESPGEAITFGWREREDAVAAVAFARDRFPGLPVAVVGQSMGGAAAILARDRLGADALVVEAVYASVERATRNRLGMRLGRFGEALTPLLTAQLRPRLGVGTDDLRPEAAIAGVEAPVLVLGGSEDAHAQPDETQALHAAAPEPKDLWIVEGTAHQDLHRFAPEAYRARVFAFLGRHLRRP
ncbi:MAG: alpha/beta fold hydrolase [Bacteroidota bacterium]